MFKLGIKKAFIALAIVLSGTMMLSPALVSADLKGDACDGVNSLSGTGAATCDSAGAQTSLDKLFKTIIQIFSVIVGFVAVVMMIVGGLKMITANGDSGAIASART